MSEWGWIWFLASLFVVVVGVVCAVIGIVTIQNLSRRVAQLEAASKLRTNADDSVARTTDDKVAAVVRGSGIPPSQTDARDWSSGPPTALAPGTRADVRGSEMPGKPATAPATAASPHALERESVAGSSASRPAVVPSVTGGVPREPASAPIPPPLSKSFDAPNPSRPPPHPTGIEPARQFEWERWLGIRGAAVGGGIVLAIAGFLFVQHSIERRWITPEIRTVLAAIAGLALFIASIPLRSRGYRIVADSITGAGAVLLYASSWAAHVSYGMIGFGSAFGAMVGVTAACAYLAQRHGSLVIAVLGLVGGFATPLVLSGEQDRPIALFGYVLLLDFAFLFVAEKRRWPSLTLVALGGTFVIQALWMFGRVDSHSLPMALIVLAVFALFFAIFVARQASAERARSAAARFGALVLPFVFAIYFAQDRTLSEHVWPLVLLASVLALAAAWMARAGDLVWLPLGTAAGAVALAMTWTVNRVFVMDRDASLELVACGVGVTLLHSVLAEIAGRSAQKLRADGARGAAVVAAIGFQLVILFAASRPIDVGPWPWILSTTLLALAVSRQVGIGERAHVFFASAAIVGITIFTWSMKQDSSARLPSLWTWGGGLVLVGSALLFAAWLLRARESHWPCRAVVAYVMPTTIALFASGDVFENSALFVAAGIIAAQGALAATVCRSSVLFGLAIATLLVESIATRADPAHWAGRGAFTSTFFCMAGFGVLFAVWPLLRPDRWIDRAAAWRIAAGSLIVQFFVLHPLFVARSFQVPVFLLPIAFEVVAGIAAVRLYKTRASEDRARRVGRIWYSCAAIFFAAMIVPLQIDREALPIALALFAAGVALFHQRIDAKSLAWVAFGALSIAFFALVVVGVFETWPHSPQRILNSVAYTHLLPAAAAIAASVCLRRAGALVPALLSGILAMVFVFAWINLEIANAFANGERFTLRYEHTPTRDLTASLAWLVYAIVLLLLGVSRQRGGLRWGSLILLLLTIAKVFVFDLSHLEGLHRAASVAGLGVSLLLVSVLYQRFVFRRTASGT